MVSGSSELLRVITRQAIKRIVGMLLFHCTKDASTALSTTRNALIHSWVAIQCSHPIFAKPRLHWV